ncbi:hypothetical protein LCGC14_0328340 [marine sediment metagenome]|uniref:Uncharacterized protein n=1 Tax=marine sediment metagenome TaxID=412755 RepID=A0A0F9THA5_9ZZZZ
MNADKKPDLGNKKIKPATLTSDMLSDMVLDHILDNGHLFIEGKPSTSTNTEHFTAVLDSLTRLAHMVAKEAIVNRMSLSPLSSFADKLSPGDKSDPDVAKYELRYRILEQYGDNDPVKDDIYDYNEAVDIYGKDFLDTYWGELGEKCPQMVSSKGNRQLWFSVVRYPLSSLEAKESLAAKLDLPSEDNLLNKITSAPGFN